MEIKNLGQFAALPVRSDLGVVFYGNEHGQDFYELVKTQPKGDFFVTVDPNNSMVMSVAENLDELSPFKALVLSVQLDADRDMGGLYHFWLDGRVIYENGSFQVVEDEKEDDAPTE